MKIQSLVILLTVAAVGVAKPPQSTFAQCPPQDTYTNSEKCDCGCAACSAACTCKSGVCSGLCGCKLSQAMKKPVVDRFGPKQIDAYSAACAEAYHSGKPVLVCVGQSFTCPKSDFKHFHLEKPVGNFKVGEVWKMWYQDGELVGEPYKEPVAQPGPIRNFLNNCVK